MTTTLCILLCAMYAILAWRDIKLGIVVLAAILPTYLLRFEIIGMPGTMLESLIWILIVVWIVKGLRDGKWKLGSFDKLPPSPRLWWAGRMTNNQFSNLRAPITLILLAAVISTFVATDFFSALGILKAYFVEPLLIFVLVSSVLEREDLPKLFLALGASALVLSLFAIAQKLIGLGIPEPWDTARRVTSVFPYPNALGLFLAPILTAIPFLLARAKRDANSKLIIFWCTTFVAGALAIFFSETQGAWIAIPSSLLLLVILRSKKIRRAGLASMIILIVISGFLLLKNPSSILQPLSSLDVRVSQLRETTSYLMDNHWLLGAGLSGYPTAIEPYHSDTYYEIFQYPHNIFLNFWVETGLLGLVGFVWLAVQTARAVKRNRNNLLVLAASAGLIEMLIHGLVDVPYFKNDLAVLTWLLIVVIQRQSIETTDNY